MDLLEYHVYDVFTDQPFAGNPLAVVMGADGLDAGQMLTIAREFNLSETIFVQAPQNPLHTAQVRIFFPTAEIPFAGHPTIGCAIHLADLGHVAGDFSTTITLEEVAGLVPVTVRRQAGVVRAELTAPVVPHAKEGSAPTRLIAAALDLTKDQIGFQDHKPEIWQGGPAFLYVPLADLAALARARPIEPHWSHLMAGTGVDSAYLYTPGLDCDFRARMFSPGAGIPEDPATGSASAILAAQLRASGALPPGTTKKGTTSFSLRQGVEMGRPSQIFLTVDHDAGGITAVRIAGTAVPIAHGRIRAPESAN
jgi:trans-2,3-dihydro-3-hydroxyanthranilate isomerase